MNFSSLEGLVNNVKSTANDTQKLLERNVLKDNFVKRLTRIHDSFFGYVDFMQKNLEFFVKNGLVSVKKYYNGYTLITEYKIGQSKECTTFNKDNILEVKVAKSEKVKNAEPEICQLRVDNINKAEINEFGLNPKWADNHRPYINFLNGLTSNDEFGELLALFVHPSWYTSYASVEDFKTKLGFAETYYLEILPKMFEVCLYRIKEEAERKNAVIRSSEGNEKKNVRKFTITITEE